MKPKGSSEQTQGLAARDVKINPPLCDCHDTPMRWNKRSDLIAGGYWRCTVAYKTRAKQWRDDNKRYLADYTASLRNGSRRYADIQRYRRYGLLPAEYDKLLEKQHNRCALCDIEAHLAPRKVLTVDHDHATGRVRGLLCIRCNSALERLERPGWTIRATAYLKYWLGH